jgi:hypothetical protein
MNKRHRQQQFTSPFTMPELELDPEKALWVPGRKKIFIPAPKPVTKWLFENDFVREELSRMTMRHYLLNYPICVPGRNELFTPRTWNDVVRSSEPMWKGFK